MPTDLESSGEDSDIGEKESDVDMKEIMAMFARSFKRGKFNRSRFNKYLFNKGEESKSDRSRGNFFKLDKSKVKCFNCNKLGHFASECRKPMNLGKGKALMSTQKDWADTSSSEDEIDYENLSLIATYSEKNNPSNGILKTRKINKSESNSDPDQGRSKSAPINAKISGKKGSNLC